MFPLATWRIGGRNTTTLRSTTFLLVRFLKSPANVQEKALESEHDAFVSVAVMVLLVFVGGPRPLGAAVQGVDLRVVRDTRDSQRASTLVPACSHPQARADSPTHEIGARAPEVGCLVSNPLPAVSSGTGSVDAKCVTRLTFEPWVGVRRWRRSHREDCANQKHAS